MTRLTFVLVAIALLACPGWATAQPGKCATKPQPLARTLSGKDAYVLAKAEATKSNKDSELLSMQTPMAGPLDAQGRSSQWMLQFISPSAKKLTVVYFTSGGMNCSTSTLEAFSGQAIEETTETIFDTARLVGIAREAGGSALDPKLAMTGSFMRSGPDVPAIWTISYITPQGRPVLEVSINSQTGAVTGKSPR